MEKLDVFGVIEVKSYELSLLSCFFNHKKYNIL